MYLSKSVGKWVRIPSLEYNQKHEFLLSRNNILFSFVLIMSLILMESAIAAHKSSSLKTPCTRRFSGAFFF